MVVLPDGLFFEKIYRLGSGLEVFALESVWLLFQNKGFLDAVSRSLRRIVGNIGGVPKQGAGKFQQGKHMLAITSPEL